MKNCLPDTRTPYSLETASPLLLRKYIKRLVKLKATTITFSLNEKSYTQICYIFVLF